MRYCPLSVSPLILPTASFQHSQMWRLGIKRTSGKSGYQKVDSTLKVMQEKLKHLAFMYKWTYGNRKLHSSARHEALACQRNSKRTGSLYCLWSVDFYPAPISIAHTWWTRGRTSTHTWAQTILWWLSTHSHNYDKGLRLTLRYKS